MEIVATVDEALPMIGEFGLHQILIVAVLSLITIPGSYQAFIIYFAAHNPPWRCVANKTDCTLTHPITSTNDENYNYRCKIDRDSWEFVEKKEYSIVTEFGLFCDRDNLIFISSSIFFFGMLLSSIPIGWCSDRFGRRKTIIPLLLIFFIVSTLSSFSPSYFWFALSRFLLGATGPIAVFAVISSEIVTTKYRPLTGTLIWFFFTLALCIMGILAMHVREWKYLMLYSTAPYLILLPLIFFIPETLRWLHVNGHLEKANNLLKKIAHINGRKIDIRLSAAKVVHHKVNPLLLVHSTSVCLKTLNLGFAWMVCGLTYYGITLASSNLSGKMYRDFILSSVVEFPAAVFGILSAMYVGRKKTTILSLFLGGLFCASVASIHEMEEITYLKNVRVALGIIGKFFLTLGFDVIYVWTIEIYPTQIRSEALSFCQIMARVGGMLSPWISLWLHKFHWRIPFAMMGILAVVASVSLSLLPETKHSKTAEVLDEEILTDDDKKQTEELHPVKS